MKSQSKGDQGSSFEIESSSLDADNDDQETKKNANNSNQGNLAQKRTSNGSQKKQDSKQLKQKKKDDSAFEIEETVATPEMIKHLVGDNTPEEPEEKEKIEPASVATKTVEAPKQMVAKPVVKNTKPVQVVAAPKKIMIRKIEQKPAKNMVQANKTVSQPSK